MSYLDGIKTIVFDFGGVIVNLTAHETLNRFAALGVANPGQFLNHYHQKGPFRELESGAIDNETFYEKLRQLTNDPTLTAEQIDHAWCGFLAGPAPQYNIDMLEDLRRRGYRLLLLSNTNPAVVRWAHSPAFAPSGKPISDYFDKLYLSCEVKLMKPDEAIYRHLLDDAQLRPEETLFIDDSQANIDAAAALGIHTYLATNTVRFTHIFD